MRINRRLIHPTSQRNCLINRKRTRERLRLTPPKATKRHLWLRSDLSWESTVRPFWNYQTVSPGTWLNKGKKRKVQGVLPQAPSA
jgi:hypothetical protein